MAEWKSIFIREKNVKKSGSKAILVACPYLSKYTGWSFWHPAKLVFDTDQQGVLQFKNSVKKFVTFPEKPKENNEESQKQSWYNRKV